MTKFSKTLIKRYKAPTPIKFKVWGKVILLFGTTMQIALQGIEVHKGWTIAIALLTAIGTVLPEFSVLHEEPSDTN